MSWHILPMCAHRRRTGCAQFATFVLPSQHSTGANRQTRADSSTTQSSHVAKASEERAAVAGVDEESGENIDRPVPATTGLLAVQQRTVANVRDLTGYGYGMCNLVFTLNIHLTDRSRPDR
jgi:hypothetical protein